MFIKEIELLNFRNYNSEKISFEKTINIISGENAQGKTNLLESIYILSLGKSFRSNRDAEMIRFGSHFCRVKAIYEKEGKDQKIELVYKPGEKKIRLNGIPAEKTSDLLDHVYTVIFSPEDLKIIKDEPEKRRRFLDRELCQLKPAYYRNLGRYKKLLAQRNILLKKEPVNHDVLTVWNQALAETGSHIILERIRFLKQLNKLSGNIHHAISDGKEKLSLNYETCFDKKDLPETVEELQNLLFNRMQAEQEQDIQRGNTGSGPHRDDIRIEINETDARRYASQGQQRTAALAMKLAEIELIRKEKEEEPILLLDDVLSELDEKRQHDLLAKLEGVQLFLTTADLNPLLIAKFHEYRLYQVKDGRIKTI
jgi:DNA replication and repair protein RecF